MNLPIDFMVEIYNLELFWIISFLLVPHLPRLMAWKRRTAVADRQTDRHYENLYIDHQLLNTSAVSASKCDDCCYIYHTRMPVARK